VPTLSAEEFRQVIGHFASGVTVITTAHDDVPYGTTASAVSSLSLEPPMLLVCLKEDSSTKAVVDEAQHFAVNILAEHQPDLAARFATKAPDKFRDLAYTPGTAAGAPLLDDALATLECRVVETVTGGTHAVFLAEVERATSRPGAPLAYFRGQFGRLELQQDEAVFHDVRGLVLGRKLPVGEPLDLTSLAEQLDVPRGSLYHALAKLSGEALVTRDADGSFVVAPLRLEAMEEAARAACAIEVGVAHQTVAAAAEEDVAALRAGLAGFRPDGRLPTIEGWTEAYNAFHERLVAMAGSTTLLDAFRRVSVTPMILSLTRPRELVREAAERSVADHAAIVEAYERRDTAGAIEAIQRHVDNRIAWAHAHVVGEA
jgi:flavin reductase (DIM6/NTAB) family NADH-FMN oxidoreductase RutF/DNA-binding FadR family transcriptional regulator